MPIWAIADLHLSFGVPDKKMDVFGPQWKNYEEKIEKNWRSLITQDDLVLIAGDISWGMKLLQAVPDLEWIHRLPGTKVILRGNHDYWWDSIKKISEVLPSSIHLIQNNALFWNGYAIGGARLWDSQEYRFGKFIDYSPNPRQQLEKEEIDDKEAEKIFVRELGRLEMSLKELDKRADKRIIMTHYPPIGSDLHASRASALLEKYHVDVCVFGHLHNIKPNEKLFGEKNGIMYFLTSCDYLNFCPIRVG